MLFVQVSILTIHKYSCTEEPALFNQHTALEQSMLSWTASRIISTRAQESYAARLINEK